MAVPNLSPTQVNQYAQQRNAARNSLLSKQASSQYQRDLADLSFKNDLASFNVNWGRKRQQLPQGFTQRGLLNSGLYHQALQDYASDRTRGLNDLVTGHQLGRQNSALTSRGYEDEFAAGMYGSYNDEYATKAQLAAKLREIM